MRRWFVIFMLFLLPIRGLVGDAMAYSMWLDTPQSVQPCHTEMTEMAAADDQAVAQSQCSSCQICHLSADTPMQLPDNLLSTATVLPEQRQTLWHSADPRLIAKTPVF
jgi:hypothetical protein